MNPLVVEQLFNVYVGVYVCDAVLFLLASELLLAMLFRLIEYQGLLLIQYNHASSSSFPPFLLRSLSTLQT